MESGSERIKYKYFVAEGNPLESPLIGLKNINNGRVLYCYLGTLNNILATVPKLREIQKNTLTEGPDEEVYSEEITTYKNKKIVGSVKRFKNKLSVSIQQLYDEKNNGEFKFSPSFIQFSEEDDLSQLEVFGQKIRKDHRNLTKKSEGTEEVSVDEVKITMPDM